MVMAKGVKTVTDDEIIRVMRQSPDPAFSTGEVAEMVSEANCGITKQAVRERLEKLRNEGRVHKKKPSSRVVMWWVGQESEDECST